MVVGGCTWRCVGAEVSSEEGDYGGIISSGFNFGADDVLGVDTQQRQEGGTGPRRGSEGKVAGRLEGDMTCR
jgi:hypothetical protein